MAYFIEWSPIKFPSVSNTSAMKPWSPMGFFSTCTLPPFLLARNAIAAEVVASQKIPIIDLNAAVRGHPEFHSDNVHFNGQGTETLATQVYAAVEKLLPR